MDERNALDGDTFYFYDVPGKIIAIIDAQGQKTRFMYDDLGRLVETKDPIIETPTDKTHRILLYDEAGNALD